MVANSIIAELCIYIFTWNVGSHYPDNVSLVDALALNGTSTCPNEQLPDLYVLALQEVNIAPKNQILGFFHDNEWTLKANDYLHKHQYVKVETEQLQGLLIIIFSQPQHIPHMKYIETQNTRTGLGGLWGNKGAVSIRMNLYGTGVTFVGAHLAAHDNNLKERIEDFHQIVKNHYYKHSSYRTIFDHDFVFWFGDLNFRLSGDDSALDIRDLIEQGNISMLIQRDQLLLVRETGSAFVLLEENLPTFPPTFKYSEKSLNYDLKRRPAWCDRILFRVEKNKYPGIQLSIHQLSYKSHSEYTLSDHKPVSSEFIYKVETMLSVNEKLQMFEQ